MTSSQQSSSSMTTGWLLILNSLLALLSGSTQGFHPTTTSQISPRRFQPHQPNNLLCQGYPEVTLTELDVRGGATTTTTRQPSALWQRRGNGLNLQAETSSSSGVNGDTSASTVVTGWRGQLLKASNFASLLCVLDCTALPIVTVVLPLFGIVAASPAQMEYLHQLGHMVALWFVLPVGGSATFLNYKYAHQQKRIALLGLVGLLLVAAANAPHSLLHTVKHGVLGVFYPLLHAVHHGIAHRATNILGCACLLGSNWWSKQSGKCLHGHDHSQCSDHNHSHSHSHDHDHQD